MSKLYIVATPIGNLGDMTLRSIETLKNVRYILAEDTRHTMKLMSRFDIKTELVSYHKFNETERTKEIVSKMLAEEFDVALVTDAGTPCISDPGHRVVSEALNEGIEVLPLPGASALISALSVSGFELKSFEFRSFFPRIAKEQALEIESFKRSECDVIAFFESPKRIKRTVKLIEKSSLKCELFLSREMTKRFETYYRGTPKAIVEMLENDEKSELGEYVIILKKELNSAIEPLQEKNPISIEAYIVDDLKKNGGTLKDALNRLSGKDYSKNELYKASLSLKKLFK